MYTDYSLMTGDQGIGEDAVIFFKNMAIGNLNGVYQNLIVSPTSLKPVSYTHLACLDLEAFALNREINSCSSLIFSSFFLLASFI